jgi:cupin superfamily acireductone dioxygenase involved in methionine salvage
LEDYLKVYEEFWKHIIQDDKGNLNLDQVKRELSDYSFLMKQASEVYCEFANLSKTNHHANTIINEINKRMINKEYALEDLLEMAEDGYVSVEDIKEYFSV